MDVSELLERLPEPPISARLRDLVADARARFTDWQREAMAFWEVSGPFHAVTLHRIRMDAGDVARLREHSEGLPRRRPRAEGHDDYLEMVPLLMEHAAAKPAVASAILWTVMAEHDPDYASHLMEVMRERGGVPGFKRRLSLDDPDLAAAGADLPELVARMADRQTVDACGWLERIPPPLGPHAGTLSGQRAAVEAARAAGPRITMDELTGFLRRAAAFLVLLSARRLDPLGFPLARNAQLDTDPEHDRRLEISWWARRAGRHLCPHGRMVVLTLAAQSPWPLQLELVAADLGHGHGAGMGLLVRLGSDGLTALTDRPLPLLLVPHEPAHERGRRFERWLCSSYPGATEQWHAWS